VNILAQLQSRFAPVLAQWVDDPAPLVAMIRPAGNPQHGDYQVNCAMPLKDKLKKPPREIAADLVAAVDLSDLCEPAEIAGPGFINLRLKNDVLAKLLAEAVKDERLGVPVAERPLTIVIDYSSPNVAKPMHVGHIRSTVIGDALYRTLKFLGHRVISDNHLGDWGTQFGMIIYGFKHFGDRAAYESKPVDELGRVYRQVRRLMDYFESSRKIPTLNQRADLLEHRLAESHAQHPTGDTKADKKAAQTLQKLDRERNEIRKEIDDLRRKIDDADKDHTFTQLVRAHKHIEEAVLEETAKLHEGDAENLKLWRDFLPRCREDIQSIYDRLNVTFDYELGESAYHDQLAAVVQDLEGKQLARESEGATCVFLDGFETPMIVRKRDGAFLYATTDLATIQYRMQHWQPDVILYVVDHRQSEHFDKLFATAKLWGYGDVKLKHIGFGTVMGDDGKPFKTRSGDTVGLQGLLDDAVAKAYDVVCEIDENKKGGSQLSFDERKQVAWVIGHSAIKYADLSQNRESDYVFSFDKMVALKGNTATYMQYAHARVTSIFAKGNVDVSALRKSGAKIVLQEPAERQLGLKLLRLSEVLSEAMSDYRPNLITDYLFDLAESYNAFYENFPVLDPGSDVLRTSRLLLCDLTARTLRLGLALLGIDVVERM
jgi:arginyl-tRNA synthetase